MSDYQLPRLLLITACQHMQPNFEAALEQALRGGIKLVQLREKELEAQQLRALAQTAAHLCESYGARLLINSNITLSWELGTGAHLPGGNSPEQARNILNEGALCGVSVHSIEEAQLAAAGGADYLVFGSVFETNSHPGAAPAGLERLHEVVQATSLPVFAVGGIDAERAKSCREAGAYGVAVISAIWKASDVVAAARGLQAAVNEVA